MALIGYPKRAGTGSHRNVCLVLSELVREFPILNDAKIFGSLLKPSVFEHHLKSYVAGRGHVDIDIYLKIPFMSKVKVEDLFAELPKYICIRERTAFIDVDLSNPRHFGRDCVPINYYFDMPGGVYMTMGLMCPALVDEEMARVVRIEKKVELRRFLAVWMVKSIGTT